MKVFGSIHERAQKYFQLSVEMFQMKFTKESEFLYHTERNNDTKWHFAFLVKRNFVSRVYKLSVSYKFSEYSAYNALVSTISWDFRKKEWQSKGETTGYCRLLNQNKKLKNMIQSVDYESIEIQEIEGEYQITMIPIPGSYVFILLPPLQYFIKMKQQEAAKIKELGFEVQATLKDTQKKTAG